MTDDAPAMAEDTEFGDFPELHEALGAITIRGSHIESLMGIIFTELIRSEDVRVGTLLGRGQNFEWLADRCLGLVWLMPEEMSGVLAQVEDAIKAAKSAMVLRNDAVHGMWWASEERGLVRSNVKRYRDARNQAVTIEELRAHHDEMSRALKGLLLALQALRGSVGADPAG